MERRTFIQKACTVCLLGMTGVLSPAMLTAASRKRKVYKAVQTASNEVIIPVGLFAEENLQIVSVKGWEYDMAVHKKEDGTYSVFLLRCTHMDNELHITGSGFVCNMHGSTYDTEGNVTKGPAEKPLEQYHATLHEDNIIITP